MIIKKTLLAIALLTVGLHFALPALAIDAGDDFNDNTVDTSKWGVDFIYGNGSLAETGGHLEFTVSQGTSYDQVLRPWITTQFPTTNDWDVVIDVANTVPLTKKNQIASLGLFIANWTDPFDSIFAELYVSTAGVLPASRGIYSELYTDNHFLQSSDTFNLQTTNGAVRIAFNSATKVMSVYYDANSSDGYQWVLLASYGINGSGGATANTSWNMTANDRFVLSATAYGAKTAVTAGTLSGDNLATTHGIDYQIPRTTLTSSFTGVKQKCQTTCALKGKLVMTNGTTSPVLPTRVRVFVSTDQVFDGADTLLTSPQTAFLSPGKSKKLTVAGTNPTSLSGMYLLAVDDSGAVLNTFLIP